MSRRVLLVALVSAVGACEPRVAQLDPVEVPVVPSHDASTGGAGGGHAAPDPGRSPCEAAAAHLESLGCDLGRNGSRWRAACENARANGATFGVRCITAATSCAQADGC